MKNLLLIFIAIISLNCFSQKEVTTKLATNTTTIGLGRGWQIEQVIRNDKDTSVFFYMAFQNIAYTYITDIGSVFYMSKSDLVIFCDKLIEYAGKEKGISITEKIGTTQIQLLEGSNSIFIQDNAGKYTAISKKKAIKLADEILKSAHLLTR
jgi:hypothetical protein